MIFSRAPPISVAEIPPEPREPTTVSTSSLEAVPISAELKPASSRLATDVEVILLKTVSVAVESLSAEALGRLAILPVMPIDLTRLLPITLITLIVSDEFESPTTVASLPCVPSIILGIILIKSSELSRLAAATAAVAASTTEVIWALVRVLESVLLVLRDETLECLELLVEERLALSSRITVEARVVVVVPVSVVLSVVVVEDVELSPEPSSLLVQPDTRINDSNRTENEKRFEKVSFRTLLYLKINLPIFNT